MSTLTPDDADFMDWNSRMRANAFAACAAEYDAQDRRAEFSAWIGRAPKTECLTQPPKFAEPPEQLALAKVRAECDEYVKKTIAAHRLELAAEKARKSPIDQKLDEILARLPPVYTPPV